MNKPVSPQVIHPQKTIFSNQSNSPNFGRQSLTINPNQNQRYSTIQNSQNQSLRNSINLAPSIPQVPHNYPRYHNQSPPSIIQPIFQPQNLPYNQTRIPRVSRMSI